MRFGNTAHYFGRLRETGISFLNSRTAIFPIDCGDDGRVPRTGHIFRTSVG